MIGNDMSETKHTVEIDFLAATRLRIDYIRDGLTLKIEHLTNISDYLKGEYKPYINHESTLYDTILVILKEKLEKETGKDFTIVK